MNVRPRAPRRAFLWWALRGGLSGPIHRRRQHIAGTVDRLDDAWILRIFLEFSAQARDAHVDRPVEGVHVALAEQLFAVEDLVGTAQQGPQQARFSRRQMHFAAVRRTQQQSLGVEAPAGEGGELGFVAFVVALGLQAVAVYVPVLQSVFQTVPLSLRDVSVVLGLSMAVWLVGEAEKLLGKLSRGS